MFMCTFLNFVFCMCCFFRVTVVDLVFKTGEFTKIRKLITHNSATQIVGCFICGYYKISVIPGEYVTMVTIEMEQNVRK